MTRSTEDAEPTLRLQLGQVFGEGGLHVICTESGQTTPRGRRAKSLGAGGSGSVYPCLYGTHKQMRAVKFLTLNKLDAGRSGRRREDFEATFAMERAVLSQLSHSNISIFHEDGIHVDDNEVEWLYLVTDHVAGPMLEDALQQPAIQGQDVYKILSDLFDAVAYLHHRGVYHCDIKLDNIRMRAIGPDSNDVVLLDWGAAQVFDKDLSTGMQSTLNIDLGQSGLRRFISTSAITHERHLAHLRGGSYSPEELFDFVPKHELHTLGVLIETVIKEDGQWSSEIRAKLSRTLGDQGIRVLDEMVQDLKSAPDGHGYSTVDELRSDFSKLHRNYLAPAGVPELGLAAEFQYSVPTATGRAVITRRMSRLADHQLINRLHNVHQLESTYLTFPGATHTRFSHSLAALRNTRYYISHLLNDSRFRRQAERDDLEATLLLAMLHDVGHFQLSHMFEDLATDQAADPASENWRHIDFDIPTDDTLFRDMLGVDPGTSPLRGGYLETIHDHAHEIQDAVRVDGTGNYSRPFEIISEEFGESTLRSLVSLHGTIYGKRKPEDVTPAQRVLAAVLSSDIDADKTAYLAEDAMRTGVSYGLGVDLDGILGNLCMPTADDFGRVEPNPVIGIRRAGVQAAQSVAVNRNQMLSQVYWHYNNRALTAMVKYPVMRLLGEGTFPIHDYLRLAVFSSRESCLAFLSERFAAIRRQQEADPLRGVVEGGRALYKRVCEVRSGLVEDAVELNEKLLKRSYGQLLALQATIARGLADAPGLRGICAGELLLDVPSKEREKPSGERGGRVFVYDRAQITGPGAPLDAESPLYSGLREQHKQVNRVSRVFLAPRWAETVQHDRSGIEVARRIVKILRTEVGM